MNVTVTNEKAHAAGWAQPRNLNRTLLSMAIEFVLHGHGG